MFFKLAASIATSLVMSVGMAQANEATIRKVLSQKFPEAKIVSVQKTPYGGLYEVYMDGQLVYADANAQYVFLGDVLDVKNRTNLTQARLAVLNMVPINQLPLNNALKTVKGKGERKLVVFSDADCPYCRKFEEELKKVSNITVYTFLLPIEALHPKAAQISRQVWCAPDRNKAWDEYMSAGKIPNNDGKCENPIDENIKLGGKLGINGTPTIILSNGQRIPGMVPAAKLEELMARASKTATSK